MVARARWALSGLTAVVIPHFLCFQEGFDGFVPVVPVIFLLLGAMAGTLASAVVQSLGSWRTRRLLYPASGLAAAVLVHAASLWGPVALSCAFALLSLPLAAFLQTLLSCRDRGLLIGSSFAFAQWFLCVPVLISLTSELFQPVAVSAAALIAGTAGFFHEAPPPPAPAGDDGPQPMERRNCLTTLGYLILVVLFYFSIDASYDWLFYRLHARDFPVPASLSLYIWLLFPLLGHILDRWHLDLRFLLCCLAILIFAPLFTMVTDGMWIFWLIYAVTLSAKVMSLIYFLMTFGQFAAGVGRILPRGIVVIPWLAMLLTFIVIREYIRLFPGVFPYISFMWVCAAGFGIISQRLQYAFTMGRVITIPKEEEGPVQPETQSLAEFSMHYGISPREQEVLALVVECRETSAIAAKLCISENTVKTHS